MRWRFLGTSYEDIIVDTKELRNNAGLEVVAVLCATRNQPLRKNFDTARKVPKAGIDKKFSKLYKQEGGTQ